MHTDTVFIEKHTLVSLRKGKAQTKQKQTFKRKWKLRTNPSFQTFSTTEREIDIVACRVLSLPSPWCVISVL